VVGAVHALNSSPARFQHQRRERPPHISKLKGRGEVQISPSTSPSRWRESSSCLSHCRTTDKANYHNFVPSTIVLDELGELVPETVAAAFFVVGAPSSSSSQHAEPTNSLGPGFSSFGIATTRFGVPVVLSPVGLEYAAVNPLEDSSGTASGNQTCQARLLVRSLSSDRDGSLC